jgi:hypothetical protein
MNYQPSLLADIPTQPANGRHPLDLYETMAPLTLALLSIEDVGGSVVEPCAGPGAMARILVADGRFTSILTNDINPAYSTDYTGDAKDPRAAVWQRPFGWCISNPPFADAADILRLAWAHCGVGVAFLLRVTFSEPTKGRGQWLVDASDSMTRSMTFGSPRPDFTGDGGDSATTAWFVWRKGWSWDRLGIARPFVFLPGWEQFGAGDPRSFFS